MDSHNAPRCRNYLSTLNHFARMFGLDVRGLRQGLAKSPRFFRDFLQFRQMTSQQGRSAQPLLRESFPIVSEYTDSAGVAEGDYFHADLWAARNVFAANPTRHVDVGSRVDGFVAHLLTFRHVEVVDLRPLDNKVDGLSFVRDDATELRSFPDRSIPSLSSLHAVEHFGLGRYGDQLQPDGYLRGMHSLLRVLAPGGHLYFAVPSGRARAYGSMPTGSSTHKRSLTRSANFNLSNSVLCSMTDSFTETSNSPTSTAPDLHAASITSSDRLFEGNRSTSGIPSITSYASVDASLTQMPTSARIRHLDHRDRLLSAMPS